MHPAPSIIVFTTLSGLGYGLAAMLGLGLLDPAALSTKIAHVLALALISTGLLSSTLHLGNPQRAWRALSQWRSSWLSREGVMAIVTFAPLLLSAWFAVIDSRYVPAIGLLGAAMCAATVYCTAMIYASLRSIDAWHTPLTPFCYLLFSAAGGALIGLFFAAAQGTNSVILAAAAVILAVGAWAAKWAWWQRLRQLSPTSTPETATGLGAIGKVRLFERPHMTENYLTHEMGFRVARKHVDKLRRIALLFGCVLPVLLVIAAGVSDPGVFAVTAAIAAVLSNVLGQLSERWLFFAEARHAVMNYYGG